MRASWKGYLRIGNLAMPVRLYGMTRSVTPRFIQLHAADHTPVQRLTVCQKDGEELSEDDIIRAAEYEGTYVELSEKELERSSAFERDIVVRQITEPSSIDPIYFDTPYYMLPDKGSQLLYAIFRRAFEKTGTIAIATLLFYGRERLAAVSSHDGMLHLQTLRFHEEIVPKSELRIPALPQPSPAQITTASQILERYSLPFYGSDYRNQQIDDWNTLIERRAKGLPLKQHEPAQSQATPENEVDKRMRALLEQRPSSLDALSNGAPTLKSSIEKS